MDKQEEIPFAYRDIPARGREENGGGRDGGEADTVF